MDLDHVLGLPVICRQVYNGAKDEPPNDHCRWDAQFEQWEETDAHFRKRIKEQTERQNAQP